MGIFKKGGTQPADGHEGPGPAPQPDVVCDLSVWVGGALRAVGHCTCCLDQYGPGRVFTAVPTPVAGNPDATRWRFTFPPGTHLQNGGDLGIYGVDGYQAYSGRFLTDSSIADISLEPIDAWPAPPSRDEVCRVNVGFQGETFVSRAYGPFHAWGPELTSLPDAELVAYVQQFLARGYTHFEFAVSWNYPTPYFTVPGADLSSSAGLIELKRRIALVIKTGKGRVKGILLFCAGDGRGAGPGYNDPFGHTYGREWLLANFQRIYDAMGPTAEEPVSVRPWIGFLAGYDATDSYGWDTPENVVSWWQAARQVIDRGGEGYLGQEWSYGHCQLGGQWDGESTYTNGPARDVDFFLQEFPADVPKPGPNGGATWQISARMVPVYHWPPDQPDGSDRRDPPYYLKQGTPRGPWYACAYEFDTYPWVWGKCTAEQVQADREYYRRLGWPLVC